MQKIISKNGSHHVRMMIRAPAVYDIDKKDFFVCNTQKYKIKRVDLSKTQLMATFNRPYKSIPFVKKKEETGNKAIGPSPALFNDVQKIRLYKSHVWIFTSTVHKEKGVWVDVFNRAGRYLDSFYLRLPQVESVHDLDNVDISVHKEFIFLTQKDEDDNSIVVKYRLK